MLIAHGAFFVLIRLFGDSTARDGDFERCNWVERKTEGELHRATHLSKGRTLHHVIASGKHAAKSAYVEKFAAQPFHGGFRLFVSVFSSLLRRLDCLNL